MVLHDVDNFNRGNICLALSLLQRNNKKTYGLIIDQIMSVTHALDSSCSRVDVNTANFKKNLISLSSTTGGK